ncbi:hypothetical protein FUAX_30790 [Fulvitalea axinellae]|uniref:histidine kinase n=1 Tax=Fulvitalea axinellae TaxID=1182444 RepID=A0AAU9CRN6_9BACT|nr:hypothetical protein FUAX_30790 [Fulvitalea axinellae]
MKKIYCIVLVFFVLTNSLWAENERRKSPPKASRNLKAIKHKAYVDSLLDVSYAYRNTTPLETQRLSELALLKSKKCGFTFREGRSYYQIGLARWNLGDFEGAKNNMVRALALVKNTSTASFVAKVNRSLGGVYSDLCLMGESLGALLEAREYYVEAGDVKNELLVGMDIALVYKRFGVHKYALRNLRECSEFFSQKAPESPEYGIIAMRTGEVLADTTYASFDFLKALACFNKAKEVLEPRGQYVWLGRCFLLWGELSLNHNIPDTAQAKHLLGEASRIYGMVENRRALAKLAYLKGRYSLQVGKNDQASKHFRESFRLYSQVEGLISDCEPLDVMADFFKANGDESLGFMLKRKYVKHASLRMKKKNYANVGGFLSGYEMSKQREETERLRQANMDSELRLQQAETVSERQSIILLFVSVFLLINMIFAYAMWRYNRLHRMLIGKLRGFNDHVKRQRKKLKEQALSLEEANRYVEEMNRRLERKVKRRTEQLNRTHGEMNELLYRASHDFRQPITTILGLCGLANMSSGISSEARELFGNVDLTIRKMDDMLGKLQAVGELYFERPHRQWMSVSDVLGSVCGEFTKEAERFDVRLETEVGDLPDLYTFPMAFELIFKHLIHNAIVFRSQDDAFVKVIVSKKGEALSLVVEDNGEGIDEEHISKVFDIYFRANRKSKGNGLGLFVVSRAVEKLRGKVVITSEPSKGTRFEILMPYPEEESKPRGKKKKETVLPQKA